MFTSPGPATGSGWMFEVQPTKDATEFSNPTHGIEIVWKLLLDAPGLTGGDSRSLLNLGQSAFEDATALRDGGSRSLLSASPVLATSVNLHGASPWHPCFWPALLVATYVKLPRTSRGHLSAVFTR